MAAIMWPWIDSIHPSCPSWSDYITVWCGVACQITDQRDCWEVMSHCELPLFVFVFVCFPCFLWGPDVCPDPQVNRSWHVVAPRYCSINHSYCSRDRTVFRVRVMMAVLAPHTCQTNGPRAQVARLRGLQLRRPQSHLVRAANGWSCHAQQI